MPNPRRPTVQPDGLAPTRAKSAPDRKTITMSTTANPNLIIRTAKGGSQFVHMGTCACPICQEWNAQECLLPLGLARELGLTGDVQADWVTVHEAGKADRVVTTPVGCACTR